MAPNKAAQDAEAKARAEAGVDPAMTAAATDVIDDGARGDPQPQAQPTEPAAPVIPPVKAKYDDKRSEIIARWNTNRREQADAERDELSDFQN
jgi:hypothetical protein